MGRNSTPAKEKHMNTTPEMLRAKREKHEDKPAVFFYDRTMSYRELDEASTRVAAALSLMGVRKGEIVSMMMNNSPEFYAVFFGIQKAGAVAGPVNCWWQTGEVEYLLNDSGTRIFFMDGSYLYHLEALEGKTGMEELIVNEADTPASGAKTLHEILGSDEEGALSDDVIGASPAAILYTSGTTGKPKGALLTHSNLMFAGRAKSLAADLRSDDRAICVLPLFHGAGLLDLSMPCLYSGASIVLRENFSASEFWGCIEDYRVTGMYGVPTIYHILLQLDESKTVDASSLRFGVIGAAPTPIELINEFENRYGMRIIEGYGLTENSGGACLTPTEGARKIGSAGVPMESVEIRIFDEDDNELPSGEVGEIVIKSEGVMKEYWKKPEETAQTMRDGWLHSGDMGRFDEDGWLYIVDRKKEMVIRGGENIYPKELEDILYAHPKISEVAVIGVPDKKYGEEVMVCIVPQGDIELTSEEIIDFCKKNMASYKVPKYVRFLEYIPKNIIGKVVKKELKTQMLDEMTFE
jgi:long-chain acyl-CoA synthetase